MLGLQHHNHTSKPPVHYCKIVYQKGGCTGASPICSFRPTPRANSAARHEVTPIMACVQPTLTAMHYRGPAPGT